MVRRLALAEAQKDLPRLIHELAAGDSVEIEEDGRVVARLTGTPSEHAPKSEGRTGAFLVGALEGLPEDVVEQFLADVASARDRRPIAMPAPRRRPGGRGPFGADDPLFTAFSEFDDDLIERFHRHVQEIHNGSN